MSRTLRENNRANAAAMASITSALLLLVTAMLSLEAQLMILPSVWVGLYLLQRVLVGKRRSSRHWCVKYTAMAAYYLAPALVFYVASNVVSYSSTSIMNDSTILLVMGVIIMFAFTIFASTPFGVLVTNMTAYSLRDRQQGRHIFLKWLFFLAYYVEWRWAQISSSNWRGLKLAALMFVHFFGMFVALFVNTSESTLDYQTKQVADYMERLKSSKSSSTSTSPFFDAPNSNNSLQLDFCRYPFTQRKDGKWFSIKDLFHQCHDLPNEDRNIWLSYSLSRLLARRYYGFHCAEEGDDKVRSFVLAGLESPEKSFPPPTTPGYKRAFRTVEVQLAFLHDYFFTASLPIIEMGSLYNAINFFSTLAFALTILSFPIAIILSTADELSMTRMLVKAVQLVLMSWCILFGFPMLPVQDLLADYWHPIHTAFRKLKCLPKPDCCPRPDGLLSLFRSSRNPSAQDVFGPSQTQTGAVCWRNKIGQYSILDDYHHDRRHSIQKILEAWFQRIMLSHY